MRIFANEKKTLKQKKTDDIFCFQLFFYAINIIPVEKSDGMKPWRAGKNTDKKNRKKLEKVPQRQPHTKIESREISIGAFRTEFKQRIKQNKVRGFLTDWEHEHSNMNKEGKRELRYVVSYIYVVFS